MNKKNKNTNQKGFKEKVLFFPNRINGIAIFSILLLYGFILLAIAVISFPGYDYVVKLNYPTVEYNAEINPYAFLRGTSTVTEDDNGNKEYSSTTQLFAYIRSLNNTPISNTTYAYSALDNGGIMRYFVESSRRGTSLPTSHNSSKVITPSEGWFEKLFIKVRYKVVKENETTIKEYRLSEDLLHLSKKELKDTKFTSSNAIENLLSISFTYNKVEDNENYEANVKLTLVDAKKPHHINFQSWLVTDSGIILPHLGLYNFCAEENFHPSVISNVNPELEAAWIYLKLIYTDVQTNQVSTMFYKVRTSDLLSKGA